MHHLAFGINFLLHSVNLVLIILLPTLLIPIIQAHLSHHHHLHRPLHLHFSTLSLKLTFSRNPSHRPHSYRTAFTDSWLLNSFSFSFSLLFRYAGRLIWLPASFWSHVKYLHFDLILIWFWFDWTYSLDSLWYDAAKSSNDLPIY